MDKTQKEKAMNLIRDFKSGMLVTLGMQDQPHCRPMMIANVDDDLMMTFVTSLDSVKVDEIRRRGTVGLTLQSPGAFVAMEGYAVVVTDDEEKRAAWHPLANLWFQSPDDPEAALVKFQPETIEYWDHRGINSLRLAFEVVKAAAKGEDPKAGGPRTHDRLSL